ncbi:poly-gamma-glutamate hydrolase family protein [Staphylococcus pasteuri]|uniref:poly-gamma-glutamate hydrolase family protein n=1 Tax=Staphylococcus pasteuri TaxID=45972 RepID=UPI002DBF8D6B|nr:poly-gamma-glutamate hydrolase family protein [Staphylococcus pasteuri]MEB7434496.1 poly-gamma-glutamate hydrolase family protein [Staphylococcus pasteuri]
MNKNRSKRTKPIVKITLGVITASLSLGSINIITQQTTAHASTVQNESNTNSKTANTKTIKNSRTSVSNITTPIKHVTTTVKSPTTVKTTAKIANVKQSSTTVKPEKVKAPTSLKPKAIQTSTSQTQKPMSTKAPINSSTNIKNSTIGTKHEQQIISTVKVPNKNKTSNTTKTQINQTKTAVSKPRVSSIKTKTPVKKIAETTTKKKTTAVVTIPKVNSIKSTKSNHKDYYKSMTQLEKSTKEGVDWKKETSNKGSKVLIVAPHGGNIEQGTSELTKLLAQQGGYDYFSFEGIRNSNNTQLHVTSTHYDDPTLNKMVKGRTANISIHGAKGDDQIVFLGGVKSKLRDAIQLQLRSRGFTVKVPPEYLGGLNNQNFINKNQNSTGIQLELTTALRKALFKNQNMSTTSRKNKNNWSPKMYQFVDALHTAIKQTSIK